MRLAGWVLSEEITRLCELIVTNGGGQKVACMTLGNLPTFYLCDCFLCITLHNRKTAVGRRSTCVNASFHLSLFPLSSGISIHPHLVKICYAKGTSTAPYLRDNLPGPRLEQTLENQLCNHKPLMGYKYTPSPVAVEQGMYTAYAALATMAILPIYFGAFASLKKWKVCLERIKNVC